MSNDVAAPEHPDDARWVTFMVYFGANDPETGLNFVIVRMPSGRVRWTKGVVPAITKLVRGLFTAQELKDAARSKRMGRANEVYWRVDGEHGNALWHLQKVLPTRYLWDGTSLQKVPRSSSSSG